MTDHLYTIILAPEPDGSAHNVTVPLLPGCLTYGDTPEEALARAQEVIGLFIATLQAEGEAVPREPMPATVLEEALARARRVIRDTAEAAGIRGTLPEPQIATVAVGVKAVAA